jgi:hypothetical protein
MNGVKMHENQTGIDGTLSSNAGAIHNALQTLIRRTTAPHTLDGWYSSNG